MVSSPTSSRARRIASLLETFLSLVDTRTSAPVLRKGMRKRARRAGVRCPGFRRPNLAAPMERILQRLPAVPVDDGGGILGGFGAAKIDVPAGQLGAESLAVLGVAERGEHLPSRQVD